MVIDVDNLPDNSSDLKKIVEDLAKKYDGLEEQNNYLAEQIAMLQQALFGRKSEKIKYVSPDQMNLFGDEVEAELPEELSEEDVVVKVKKRKSPGRKPFPDHLVREDHIHDVSEDKLFCCGQEKKKIGEQVSERLRYIPAQLVVERHIYLKRSCSICEGTESDGPSVVQAPAIPQLIPKSMTTPSLLANIMTAKFVEGMPFYRVEQRFKRDKISISRNNMTNWAIAAADECLPLYNLLADTMKSQNSIGIDESVLQVLDEPNKTPESKSYMWVFRSNTKNLPIIYYQYDPSRGSIVPTEFLLDYKGSVQTDGYSAYGFLDYMPDVIHIVCWAHARRYFIDVIKARGKSKKMKKKRKDKTGKAEEATHFIKRLYKIEKEMREAELSPEEIFTKRQRESVPVLKEFKKWLDDISLRTPKKGLLGKAISYTLNQWPRLIKYVEDGNLLIDNNLVENAIRPYVIGRKAWLFFKSQRGAEAGAVFYSLVETAKAYDLNPEHYFNHIFTKLPTADTLEKLEILLPWNLTPEQIKPAHSPV